MIVIITNEYYIYIYHFGYSTSIRENVEVLWVDSASSLTTWIWRTSTLHMIQSCVTVRLGISWVIEFLHGGTPLFALRYCPYRLLNRTCIPSSDIGSHSADESNFPGKVWSTLFHKQSYYETHMACIARKIMTFK